MSESWICRESLFHHNANSCVSVHVWEFETESEARAQFESRKNVYLSDREQNNWVNIGTISDYLYIFYNVNVGDNIVLSYYRQDYNSIGDTV